MIPILYEPKETDFTTNGIGFLKDATECTVKEVRNGTFELTLKYPENGVYAQSLTEDAIIKAKPNNKDADQLFRIYKSGKTIAGVNTFYAEHISYELNSNPVCRPEIKSKNAQQAIEQILSDAAVTNNYTAWSDITTVNKTSVDDVVSVRKMLGGVDGSILDVWGGEYQFDNFTIKLWKHRGTDKGETIRYGKNLITAEQEKNIANTITAVFPFAYYKKDESSDEEIFVKLPENIIKTPNADKYARLKCEPVDFSDEFDDGVVITEDMLRKAATTYAQSGIDEPSISIKTTFQEMSKIKEYGNLATFNSIDLCDTVTVIIEKLDIDVKAKVVSYTYNVLKERPESVEIGETRTNLTKQITAENNQQVEKIIKTATFSETLEKKIKQRIADVTAAITGNSGGYVVLYPQENPQEIFIMDTPDTKTSKNVWRWNQAGLAHSSNGVNGPFNVAITADGGIVADFIDTGEFNGMLIKAGTIKAESLSVEYKESVKKQINDSSDAIVNDFTAKLSTTQEAITAEVGRATAEENTINDSIGALSQSAKEFQETVEGSFRDGIIDEAETQTIERHLYELARDNTSIQKQYSKIKAFTSSKETSNGSNASIKFNSKCETEVSSSGSKYDYVNIYYEKDGKIYDALGDKASGADLAGKTFILPSKDIYISWRSDSSNSNYYGFSIDAATVTTSTATHTGKTASLPNYDVIETSSIAMIQTPHPYENNMTKLWHLRLEVTTQAELDNAATAYNDAYNALVSSIRSAITDKKATAEEITNVNTKFTEYNTTLSDFQKAITSASVDVALTAAGQAAEYAAASFRVTADAIEARVLKNDEGSYITQYYDKVLATFNKNSKVVQLTAGQIGIYNETIDDAGRRSVFDQDGNKFWRDSYYVGKIGTNSWAKDDTHKGLVFDLEAQGKYMAWAEKTSASDDNYSTVLCYSRANSIYTEKGLHLGANVYGHNFDLYNVDIHSCAANGYNTVAGKSIPVITDIKNNGDGTISWTKSSITVRTGMITAVPDNSVDI